MTADDRPRLVIIDPSLEPAGPGERSSHAFRYACAVLAAADRRGVIVGRRGFAGPADLPEGCLVHGTLPFGPHAKVTAAGELDRLDDRGRSCWRPQPPWAAWHRARRREERIEGFARGVQPVLADLRAGDVVFVSTASELEAAGLARAVARAAPPPGIGWHVQFHTPLERGYTADRPRQVRRLERIRRILAAAHRPDPPHTLHWHATTAELAAEYSRLGAGGCDVLPYPILAAGGYPPRRAPATRPLRLAALGDARPEKNSHRLLGVVDSVQRDPQLADAVRFVIQRNLGFPSASTAPEHEAVRRCLAGLAGRTGVDLLDGPLDDARYEAQLAAADIALLAYDQRRYRTRLSAVLLEALAWGAVPIVTGGGWMARQLEDPLRRHVALVTAAADGGSAPLLDVAAPRIGVAGLVLFCPLPVRTVSVIVEITWPISGPDALAEPPLRVALEGPDRVAATVITAPTGAHPGATLFPVLPTGESRSTHLRLRPAVGADRVDVARIRVRCLTGTAPPPCGAAGLVIDDTDDLPAALAELARHADHYRAGAAAASAVVRQAHSPAAVVARLMP